MTSTTQLLIHGLEYLGLYYGTYRGTVKSVDDPDGLGRIQVHCQAIHGALYPLVWAYPVAPCAGKSFGIWHVPDVGEWVHVRFDHGRLEYPMWEGGWWGQGDPTSDMVPTNVVVCTKEGLKIVLNRSDKTVTIQQADGNNIVVSQGTIEINHAGDLNVNIQGSVNIAAQGKATITSADEIDLVGNTKITGALTVTGEGTFNGHTVTNHTHGGVQSGSSSTATPLG